MRPSRSPSIVTLVFVAASIASFALCGPARASGLLGVFFDESGSQCAGDVNSAGKNLYVLFIPSGSTSGGITGAEFRIDTQGDASYIYQGEEIPSDALIKIGSAFGNGCNVAFSACKSRSAITVLKFAMYATGNGSTQDLVLRIQARRDNTNPAFACPLVTLCDDPVWTKVCVDPGRTIVNPSSGQVTCGSSRLPAQWTRVKELYRR